MSVQTTITRQDPAIEAYRLGLLGDVQGLVRNQMFGQQVQNLRAQGLTDEQIAAQLSTEDNQYTAENIGQISQGAMFAPPDYQVAGLSQNQLDAANLAARGVGSYQPYIQGGLGGIGQGRYTTGQGINAIMQGLAAATPGLNASTFGGLSEAEMARQIAGQGLGFARMGTQGAMSDLYGASDQAAQVAAMTGQQLNQLGAGAQNIASDVTGRARSLQGPLEGRMLQASQRGLGQAARGQFGADLAAALARRSTAAAQGQLGRASQFGMDTARAGIAGLTGAAREFNPYSAYSYMNPYEDVAVQQALQDIRRQGDIQSQNVAAQAIQSGAFGGSREAVQQAELGRNILEQQGRTAAQMRQAGFESAAQRAQSAFEQARQRQLQAASTTGQLGQAGAGTAASAAQAAGQLGLSAEQLAQTGALQGAQLGLSASQFEAANAKAIADTGLSIEQLASQTGLQAQQLAGQFAQAAGQMGMDAARIRQAGAQQAGALSQGLGSLYGTTAGQMGQLGMSARQLQASNAAQLGSLGLQAGQQFGNLGAQQAQMGIQQAGLGELEQAMRNRDISSLMQTGGMLQAQDQSVLDAIRMSNMQRYQQPFQQLGFLSDVYAGIPTSQSTQTMTSGSNASPFMQAASLGIAGLSAASGAQQAGIL